MVEEDQARVTTIGGHVCPIYVPHFYNEIRLSNVASRLINENETVLIDGLVFLQNLSGIPYPQVNIF